MNLPLGLFIAVQVGSYFALEMTDRYSENTGNYNDAQSYVVGILSPSTTLYIDQTLENRSAIPPNDLALRRRNTNSFQITSVTVQGSRKNDDTADDSADDFEESHTDDLSSDFLDSSRADNEGYNTPEDYLNPMCDDLSSPCGPIIYAQLPPPMSNMKDPNMNLSIGVTPTYTAMGPVAGGVTMMTSKSESPISAQVPIMNPLPENWQRRFRVVKIVSSEPFKRGRWTCMDFKDPPTVHPDGKVENNGKATPPPTIQVTNYDEAPSSQDQHLAHLCGLPIEQTFNGNFVMRNQQQMYGIILPQNDQIPPVALVQDMSIQTTMDRNSNHIVDMQQNYRQFQQDAIYHQNSIVNNGLSYSPHCTMQQPLTATSNSVPQKPYSQSAINVNSNQHINSQASTLNNNTVPADHMRHRTNSGSNVANMNARNKMETENSESFSSFANELSRTSGYSHTTGATVVEANVANGHYSPPPRLPAKPATQPHALPITVAKSVVAPPTALVAEANPPTVAEHNSSQSAPEKIPSAEVGQDVENSTGSAASTGSNTVAIDNKIEQAMDLVKSHLMFAVREEVEVLKEKISELLERISQLEHENDILRANASAETLKQLNNQSHKKIMSGQGMKPPQPSST